MKSLFPDNPSLDPILPDLRLASSRLRDALVACPEPREEPTTAGLLVYAQAAAAWIDYLAGMADEPPPDFTAYTTTAQVWERVQDLASLAEGHAWKALTKAASEADRLTLKQIWSYSAILLRGAILIRRELAVSARAKPAPVPAPPAPAATH